MPLVNLLNTPKNELDWSVWGWSHRDSHTKIRQAIQQQKDVNLFEYDIDPINFDDIENWLERNQRFHTDMNGALQVQGSDLQGVNLKDEKELAAWILAHFLEHQTAELALKI